MNYTHPLYALMAQYYDHRYYLEWNYHNRTDNVEVTGYIYAAPDSFMPIYEITGHKTYVEDSLFEHACQLLGLMREENAVLAEKYKGLI